MRLVFWGVSVRLVFIAHFTAFLFLFTVSVASAQQEGPRVWVAGAEKFPSFQQTNGEDLSLYVSSDWANTEIEGVPRKDETCLAVVYAILEHARGNTSHRVGQDGTWSDDLGALDKFQVQKLRDLPADLKTIQAEIRSGSPIILQGFSRRLGTSHFMLAIGLTADQDVIALDPLSGSEIIIPSKTMVAETPQLDGAVLAFTVMALRTLDYSIRANSEQNDSVTEQTPQYAESNRLFAQAVRSFVSASSLPMGEREAVYAEIRATLDQISAQYPESIAGKRILSGASLGAIDRERLYARTQESSEKMPGESWTSDIVHQGIPPTGDCRWSLSRECLEEVGAREVTIQFVESISEAKTKAGIQGVPGIFPVDFQEAGRVDVVWLDSFTNSGKIPYFLNVNPNTIAAPSFPSGDIQNLAASNHPFGLSAIRQYPKAVAWFRYVRGARLLSDGSQRFSVESAISEGCRACPPIGRHVGFVVFDEQGKMVSFDTVGILDNRDLGKKRKYEASDLERNPKLIQYFLNIRGYPSGEMDGVLGPSSRRALADFQREHGVNFGTGNVDRDTILALVDQSTLFANGRQTGEALARSAASPYHAPEGYFWLQISSTSSELEAIERAQRLRQETENIEFLNAPRVFQANNGWFAVTAGQISSETIPRVEDLKSNGFLPSDAFAFNGETFVREVAVPQEPERRVTQSNNSASSNLRPPQGPSELVVLASEDFCEIHTVSLSQIKKQVRSGGGLAPLLGAPSDGREAVGQGVAHQLVAASVVDAANSSLSGSNVRLVARDGRAFESQLNDLRFDNVSLNRVESAKPTVVDVPLSSPETAQDFLRRVREASASCSSSTPFTQTSMFKLSPRAQIVDADRLVEMISLTKEVQRVRGQIAFIRGGLESAVAHGLVSRIVQHAQADITNFGNSWEAKVTSMGKDRGLATSSTTSFVLSSPTDVDIKLSTISVVSEDPHRIIAEFEWSYSNPSDTLKRFGNRGGQGRAIFEEVADEWKLLDASIGNGLTPYPHSPQMVTVADEDILRVRREGGPWVFTEREQTFVAATNVAVPLTSTERTSRANSADRNQSSSATALLANSSKKVGGQVQYDYLLEGSWFEFATGEARIAFILEDVDLATGRFNGAIASMGATGMNPRGMRLLHSQVGYVDGYIDLSDFSISMTYYPGAKGPKGTIVRTGEPILDGIKLDAFHDDNGEIRRWKTGQYNFGGLVGSLLITTKKIRP